jgi:hypothetical protein
MPVAGGVRPKRFEQGQAEQSVAGRNKIVGHHAEAVFDVLVEVAGRLRLGDVEIAEQRERRPVARGKYPASSAGPARRDDFVPDDAAVVGVADRLAGDIDEPDAEQVGAATAPSRPKSLKWGGTARR